VTDLQLTPDQWNLAESVLCECSNLRFLNVAGIVVLVAVAVAVAVVIRDLVLVCVLVRVLDNGGFRTSYSNTNSDNNDDFQSTSVAHHDI
jgi:hypothetical protein